ncbi:beta-glucuronidase [Sulfodiicoccus acidiphilus]|uniref:Beta-glucuronidase n=1 Tax=Sulfodiicoccus acidiphilus TaxID=1670455 RepID=A0A348B523_9CREN|nr:glycoside hydrolase family 2 TIM barrel-domain containing protein [Sulfodiicoccus acidiphilus]BBD73275.1 beta-glucuronidase [Sulfodiicoccus acidiphilus]GGT89437.1 beta-glucuronidase [Sulfodiicoccus acidiphilus]
MRTDSRWRFDLSGFWRFRPDPKGEGDYSRGFEGEPIYVPASWNEQNPAWDQLGTVGWYLRDFRVEPPQGDMWLVFEGAGYRTRAWLNGEELGEHEGSFTKFRLKCSPRRGWNRLVVRVDNTIAPDSIPPGDGFNDTYFDFFHYGGIHRPVYLEATPSVHAEDLFVTGDADGNLRVEGRSNSEAEVVVELRELGKTWKMGVVDRFVLEQRVTVTPWSPEVPRLYSLEVRVGNDEVYERVGFRTVEVESEGLRLNGRKLFLKGFGRHEDFPTFGRRIPGPALIRDFQMMKEVGANSFRTSHYPYSDEHLDLADEMGFLVILETPLVGLGERHFRDRSFLEKAVNVTREMVVQHRSRPSVIMYSLMNEPDSRTEEARAFASALKDVVRALDSTRPITHASNRFLEDRATEVDDVVSVNMYFGWYTYSGDLEEGTRKAVETVEEVRRKFGKPVLVTEFGADALSGVHWDPPVAWTEEYQAEMIRRYVESLSSLEYVAGLHVWNFADFRTPQGRRGPTRTVLNRKGVVTRDRQPKLAWKVLKDLFSLRGGEVD